MASSRRGDRDPERTSKASGGSPQRSGGRRAEEEEVGRPARGGRSHAPASAGPGLGLRVGLIAGLLTLAFVALVVVTSGKAPPAPTGPTPTDQAGLAVAAALASVDSGVYGVGKSAASGTKFIDTLKRTITKLFGDRGRTWFDEQVDSIKKVDKEADEEDREEQRKRLLAFEKALEELEGGGGDASQTGSSVLKRALRSTEGSAFDVVAAWVTEGTAESPGKFVVGTHEGTKLAVDLAQRVSGGQGTYMSGGTVEGTPVRVYWRNTSNSAATVFVALWSQAQPAPSSGAGMLGWLMLLVAPLVVGGAAGAVAAGQAAKVKDLAREIERLGTSGDPTRTLRAQGPEASSVARAVERMVANLEFRQQHGAQGSEDMDAIVERERKVAQEIHDALINKHPPRLSDYEVEHLFKPGLEIAGDHFEYFKIDDEHLGVILLDTNVRGIPAALVMSSARSYVRAAAPGNLSPAAVLKQVNKHLAGELPPGRHVTALYAVVDTAQHKVTLASAGGMPVLVYRQATGKIAKVNPAGIALGLDVGPVFDRELQEGDVPLGPGDRLALYTDGGLRITNENGEEFGEQRFYQAVAREAPKNSQAFVNFVGSAIDQFHLQTPQNDDVTISTLKRLR